MHRPITHVRTQEGHEPSYAFSEAAWNETSSVYKTCPCPMAKTLTSLYD